MRKSNQSVQANENDVVLRLRLDGFRTSWLKPPERIESHARKQISGHGALVSCIIDGGHSVAVLVMIPVATFLSG